MRLYASPTSPYTRRIRILLDLLAQQYEIVMLNPHDRPPELLAHNPLSRIPTLILDNGESIIDSALIGRYLIAMSPNCQLLPDGDDSKWIALNGVELIDGATDYTVAMFLESMRSQPEDRIYDQGWLSIDRVLSWTNHHPMLDQGITYFSISLLMLVEYLDLRSGSIRKDQYGDWRARHPAIADWHAAIKEHPSFVKTRPPA